MSLSLADLIALHRDLSVVGINEVLDVLRADLFIPFAQANFEQVVKLENVRSGGFTDLEFLNEAQFHLLIL